MSYRDVTAYATIGVFADEEMIVSVGTSRQEALDLADEFHTDRHGEWDTDADREAWRDSLAFLELRGDKKILRRFVSITQSEVTFSPKVARVLNPYIPQEA